MDGDSLTIRVVSKSENVPVRSLIKTLEKTIEVLSSIAAKIGSAEGKTPQWEVVSVSMDSPLTIRIASSPDTDKENARIAIQIYTSGLRDMEEGAKSIPKNFNPRMLEHVRELVSVYNAGVQSIFFATPDSEQLKITQKLAATVDELLPSNYDEYGSLVGTMEIINIHQKWIFNIFEELTRNRVTCHFIEGQFDQARAALARNRRVEVTGRIHYSSDNIPKTIKVDTIRTLRSKEELPQASDLEGINITDGEDPVTYIRRIRDAF
jgi:hypothetical protein